MSQLNEAIQKISSPYATTVIGELTKDGNYLCDTSCVDTAVFLDGSHTHSIYGKTKDVPSMDTARRFVSDLKAVAEATKDELTDADNKIQELGEKMSNVSGLLQSITLLQQTLETSIADEQSSHRRFEQLVQSLTAAQTEVRALYDSIDKAIKEATQAGTNGALKQIDDKGRESVQAVGKIFEEKRKFFETETVAKLLAIRTAEYTQFSQEVAAFSKQHTDEAKAQVELALQTIKTQVANLEKQTLQRLAEGTKGIVDKAKADLNAEKNRARQQLSVDLEASVPALFRTTGGAASFWSRLKWLLTGKV